MVPGREVHVQVLLKSIPAISLSFQYLGTPPRGREFVEHKHSITRREVFQEIGNHPGGRVTDAWISGTGRHPERWFHIGKKSGVSKDYIIYR